MTSDGVQKYVGCNFEILSVGICNMFQKQNFGKNLPRSNLDSVLE